MGAGGAGRPQWFSRQFSVCNPAGFVEGPEELPLVYGLNSADPLNSGMNILDSPSRDGSAEHLFKADGIPCDTKPVSGIDATGGGWCRAGDGKKGFIIEYFVHYTMNPVRLRPDDDISLPVRPPSRVIAAEAHRFGEGW